MIEYPVIIVYLALTWDVVEKKRKLAVVFRGRWSESGMYWFCPYKLSSCNLYI